VKKILITGAGGFIGSHLVEMSLERGYTVRAFVHYNSKNSWGWLETLPNKEQIDVFIGDIRDYDSVYQAVKGCDAIMHLAALIGIPYSYTSPAAYIRTNIEGTYNILQAAKELKTRDILVTSTSETYGTAQYVPINEEHPTVGQSPYSATKIAADALAISYYRSFDLPVKIVRPFNTYGPRQSGRAIIPTIITQMLAGEKHIKLGNIEPTRDLTFVKDTAEGFIEIFESKKLFGEITNIGMGQEISIGNLVQLISKTLNIEISIDSDAQRIRPENSEVERLLCDNKKLLSNTNWKPKYTLETGLSETIDFLKLNLGLYKHNLYNV
jgi:Nucleoside-diphosphate-sugar epimerases